MIKIYTESKFIGNCGECPNHKMGSIDKRLVLGNWSFFDVSRKAIISTLLVVIFGLSWYLMLSGFDKVLEK
jgi:hypothetical protein